MKKPYWPKVLEQTKTDVSVKNIKVALEALGNPHEKLKNIIHVAGTNGKGSTCAFISSILRHSGYSVNVFTSPHLVEFNERFLLNGTIVSDEELNHTINKISQLLPNESISYFEACVLFAIDLFVKYPADLNIFEVGLGGRFDATNIFESKIASVITKISIDHTELLGDTIDKIAFEKAGIIQKNDNVFTIEQDKNVLDVFQKKTIEQDAKLRITNKTYGLKSGLIGRHQVKNMSLSINVCRFLKSIGFYKIDKNSIKLGVLNAKNKGRIEKIKIKNLGEVTFDVAHNEDGIREFCKYIRTVCHKSNAIAVFASLENKDISRNIEDFKKTFKKVYIPKVKNEEKKFKDQSVLQSFFEKNSIQSKTIDDIYSIKKTKNEQVFIFGSIYYVGSVID